MKWYDLRRTERRTEEKKSILMCRMATSLLRCAQLDQKNGLFGAESLGSVISNWHLTVQEAHSMSMSKLFHIPPPVGRKWRRETERAAGDIETVLLHSVFIIGANGNYSSLCEFVRASINLCLCLCIKTGAAWAIARKTVRRNYSSTSLAVCSIVRSRNK